MSSSDGPLSDETADYNPPSSSTGEPPIYSQLAVPANVPAYHSFDAQASSSSSTSPHASLPNLQFDIVPPADSSSFQAGYQGLQQRGFDVWLRGDVLLKGSSDEGNVESSAASKPSWSRW